MWRQENSVINWALVIPETTTPTAQDSIWRIYTKSDNKLYFQDWAWVEHTITITP